MVFQPSAIGWHDLRCVAGPIAPGRVGGIRPFAKRSFQGIVQTRFADQGGPVWYAGFVRPSDQTGPVAGRGPSSGRGRVRSKGGDPMPGSIAGGGAYVETALLAQVRRTLRPRRPNVSTEQLRLAWEKRVERLGLDCSSSGILGQMAASCGGIGISGCRFDTLPCRPGQVHDPMSGKLQGAPVGQGSGPGFRA